MGSGIIAPGSGNTSHWDRDQQFFEGLGCTIFVGSETNNGHTFGIKDQKFVYKNRISDEKTYLVTTLLRWFADCVGSVRVITFVSFGLALLRSLYKI